MSASSPRFAKPPNSNPFRRNKQAQILGIDNPSFVANSDDVSSIRSGFSDHSLDVLRRDSKKARVISPYPTESDAASTIYSKHSSNSGDDASSFTASMYNANSPEDDNNPFEEELEDEEDSIDELEPSSTRLRRRRTVPSKAGVVIDADNDNPWRTSTKLGNHSSSRKAKSPEVPDSNLIPLKAQKTLGISKRGKLMTEDDFRRAHSLSPETDNVAPKALKMLGIPSNPFQKPQHDENRQTFGDELEQHGSKGPTSMHKRPMDVDDFKRMLLSGDREYMTPGYFHPNIHRDSSSNTDVSSLSRSSLLSSRPDSHVETPRSSHDLSFRPALTRIATDPGEHGSPINELGDSSPASLNKPLPPAPYQTAYELAGSSPPRQMPDPSTRRRIQQNKHAAGRWLHPEPIAELPVSHEFSAVELPAEPVDLSAQQTAHAQNSPESQPGSEAQPIELPAREATPTEAPQRSFRPPPSHIATQARSPPAVPPPRRGGSHRNTIVMAQGIPELAEKSPEPRQHQLRTQHPTERGNPVVPSQLDSRVLMKPPIPPARTSSNRRLDPLTIPLANQSFTTIQNPQDHGRSESPPAGAIELPHDNYSNPHLQAFPPRPPPRRPASGGASRQSETQACDGENLQELESPGTRHRPTMRPDASPSRLPRLQTQMINETAASSTEHIVSALSPDSNARHPLSPGDTISILSMDSAPPASKKPSLGSIAMAVAGNTKFTIPGNSYLDRRPSRQETLQVLDKVVHDDTKTEKEKIDILADLGALQREVDALRRSYEHQGKKYVISEDGEEIEEPNNGFPAGKTTSIEAETLTEQETSVETSKVGPNNTTQVSEAEEDTGFVTATE